VAFEAALYILLPSSEKKADFFSLHNIKKEWKGKGKESEFYP
jgi:hypothetical protein